MSSKIELYGDFVGTSASRWMSGTTLNNPYKKRYKGEPRYKRETKQFRKKSKIAGHSKKTPDKQKRLEPQGLRMEIYQQADQ